jgi:hypothetical protein
MQMQIDVAVASQLALVVYTPSHRFWSDEVLGIWRCKYSRGAASLEY